MTSIKSEKHLADQANTQSTDLLSEVIRSVRLEGSIFFRSHLTAPWGMELPAADEPRFHIVIAGEAWLRAHNMTDPILLKEGSAVLLRDGDLHWIADHPETPKVPSQQAAEAHGRGQPLFQGTRSDCHILCGSFRFDRDTSHPLFDTLPQCSVISGTDGSGLDWLIRTGSLMDGELTSEQPGGSAMMDRLCELFLIQMLRHLLKHSGDAAGFIAALDDLHINKALQCIHAQPAEPWNLENLADIAGLSRSAFAKRFHDLVGVPPKTYLTMWRMQKARALLRNPYKLLEQVASEVGYSSDVALIRAFQRQYGMSPTVMRRRLAKAI